MSKPAGAFSPTVRATILERSNGQCEICKDSLYVTAGAVHHRRPRRMGGDRRPETASVPNGLAICDNCHVRVENRGRKQAQADGLILSAGQEPATEPCKLHMGWVILTEDGGYEHVEAPNG